MKHQTEIYQYNKFQNTSTDKILTKNKQMQDQQTCNFWFKITPTDIIPNSKAKTSNKKSILIKLGNKQAKSKSIGQPVEITVQVLHSKTLNKFCPIKGIIKIYDVNKDGSQMISCVGAFNTQQLLSETTKISNLQRDIGPCKIFLTVEVRKINEGKQPKSKAAIQIQTLKEPKPLDEKTQNIKNTKSIRQKIKFLKCPRIIQTQCNSPRSPTPYIMDDSCEYGQEASKSRCSDKSEKNQKQVIGQQLVQQRRKNRTLQQKVQKLNLKIQLLKSTVKQKNKEIKVYNQNFINFTNSLDTDQRGQYIFEMNQKKRQISLRYKQNSKFKQTFEQFIQFMIGKLAQNISNAGTAVNMQEQMEINKIMEKIDTIQKQKNKQMQENLNLRSQLGRLKQQQRQKIIEISTKDQIIKKKIQQINILEQKYRKAYDQKRNLQNLYQYLQDRDSQMQNLVNIKQSEIEKYKKTINENNIQLDSIMEKNTKLIKIINNFQLTIEEMKEQNSNLSQVIENYRQKFGDLKANKDRVLQRQLKQCLRWIEQQNRDIQMNFQDTTLELTQPASTVNSIMKSIGEIENMPLQQISVIRKQVISVLKRLDQFVAKNSFAGMSSN